MVSRLLLAQADYEIQEPIVGWSAHYLDASPPMVELIASVRSGPRQTSAPSRGNTATSVAIQMDVQVAINLYQRIADLAHSMGWPLPP
jgi:hypothetical protein